MYPFEEVLQSTGGIQVFQSVGGMLQYVWNVHCFAGDAPHSGGKPAIFSLGKRVTGVAGARAQREDVIEQYLATFQHS